MDEFIRGLPKAELHMHLEGSLEPELALVLARRNAVRLGARTLEELRASYRFANLQAFLDVYYEVASTLVTEADFHDLTRAYLERARRDNVRHAELFFDPQMHVRRGVDFTTVITGIRRALVEEGREHGIGSHLIMCFLRHLSVDEAMATLERALPFKRWLVGVGLDSSEHGHPPAKFARVFARARREGFRVVAHAGEEGPPEYVRQALDVLGAERIDHGIRALEDPLLVARLSRERVPLTVCPLSNVRLRLVPSMEQHGLKRLLEAGVLVTVNSDDPAYFGGYVADNYLAVARALGLGRADLHRLAANSFRASFLPNADKYAFLRELDDYVQAH